METNKKTKIESMYAMMKSCYAYGGIDKNTYNYQRYILPFYDELGENLFNRMYRIFSIELLRYKIIENTSVCCDGLTYNSLVKN